MCQPTLYESVEIICASRSHMCWNRAWDLWTTSHIPRPAEDKGKNGNAQSKEDVRSALTLLGVSKLISPGVHHRCIVQVPEKSCVQPKSAQVICASDVVRVSRSQEHKPGSMWQEDGANFSDSLLTNTIQSASCSGRFRRGNNFTNGNVSLEDANLAWAASCTF